MRTSTTLLLLLSAAFASAQNSYTFSRATVPFAHILDGNACTLDAENVHIFDELNGETFWFYGIPFTFDETHFIFAGDIGFINVQNDSSLIGIDGLFTPLYFADPGTAIVYRITGDPGAKVLAVEWRDWGIENDADDNDIASWTITIHQGTGVIEMSYTSNNFTQLTYTDETGPHVGITYMPLSFDECYEKLWVEQNAQDPVLDSVADFDFDGLHNLPAPHTVFRFTPRFQITTGIDQPVAAAGGTGWYNAATDELQFAPGTAPVPHSAMLFDAQGRCLRTFPVAGSGASYSMAGLASGVYTVRLDKGGTLRFVKP